MKIHYLTFDLELGVNVTQNVTKYPLHHVIYAITKFEVATSRNNYKNVTDGQRHRRTDTIRTYLGAKLIYPIFLTKKRV